MRTDDSVRLSAARRRAVEYFHAGACVRRPNEDRFEEGAGSYKKGWEIRFSLRSRAECAVLKRVLTAAGLRPGRPYQKHGKTWITPMYGREQVARFLGWVDKAGPR